MKVFNVKAFAHYGIFAIFASMAHYAHLFQISDSWSALIFALQIPVHISLFCTKLKPTIISGSIKNRITNRGFMCNVGNSIEVSGNVNCDIEIDGKSYSGKNLKVKGNTAYIDDCNIEVPVRSITVKGDVESVSTVSADVNIHKNARNVDTVSGNVTCGGDITGSIDTVSGNVSNFSLGKR